MTRVLVTGVRGKTGVPLAALLTGEGVEVLGGSSDPTSVSLPGVRPVAFSWTDRSTWSDAVAGVDAIFLVRPDVDPAPELIGAFLDTTPPGVRVTLLSERNADLFPPGHWARRVEQAVTTSRHPWAILRPSWFMQVFDDDRFYAADLAAGRLRFPSGGATVAWIDAADIAAVGACTLLDTRYDGTVHELSGPESLTLPETADVLGARLGHDVTYEDVSTDDAVDGLTGFGRQQTVETFERLIAGEFAEVTDAVEAVTGRPATALARFGSGGTAG